MFCSASNERSGLPLERAAEAVRSPEKNCSKEICMAAEDLCRAPDSAPRDVAGDFFLGGIFTASVIGVARSGFNEGKYYNAMRRNDSAGNLRAVAGRRCGEPVRGAG